MLTGLTNLGPTIVKRLNEVGIKTKSDLKRVGPAAAYQMLCKQAGKTLPVCYYLYSLQGALKGKDWRTLSQREKDQLQKSAGLK